MPHAPAARQAILFQEEIAFPVQVELTLLEEQLTAAIVVRQ